jgi:hypothetical protein
MVIKEFFVVTRESRSIVVLSVGLRNETQHPDYHTANVGFETVSLHALRDLATTQPTKITGLTQLAHW